MASARSVSLIVAASVGTVEALKDQAGLCRWNHALRSLQRRARSSDMGSVAQARRMSSSSSSSSSSIVERMKGREGIDEKAKRSEESLRKVMYLSCWGPN